MILGVGTDIVSVTRIERLWLRYGRRFCHKILHKEDYLWISEQAPHRGLAKCFSAKEALSKALGSGIRFPLTWKNVGVSRDLYGRPFFVFDEFLKDHFSFSRIHLSLSDERDVTLAFVVVEKEEGF